MFNVNRVSCQSPDKSKFQSDGICRAFRKSCESDKPKAEISAVAVAGPDGCWSSGTGGYILQNCRFRKGFRRPTPSVLDPQIYGASRMSPLARQASTNTMHGAASINDLRSWSLSDEDRRRHFLDHMRPTQAPLEIGSEGEPDGFLNIVEVTSEEAINTRTAPGNVPPFPVAEEVRRGPQSSPTTAASSTSAQKNSSGLQGRNAEEIIRPKSAPRTGNNVGRPESSPEYLMEPRPSNAQSSSRMGLLSGMGVPSTVDKIVSKEKSGRLEVTGNESINARTEPKSVLELSAEKVRRGSQSSSTTTNAQKNASVTQGLSAEEIFRSQSRTADEISRQQSVMSSERTTSDPQNENAAEEVERTGSTSESGNDLRRQVSSRSPESLRESRHSLGQRSGISVRSTLDKTESRDELSRLEVTSGDESINPPRSGPGSVPEFSAAEEISSGSSQISTFSTTRSRSVSKGQSSKEITGSQSRTADAASRPQSATSSKITGRAPQSSDDVRRPESTTQTRNAEGIEGLRSVPNVIKAGRMPGVADDTNTTGQQQPSGSGGNEMQNLAYQDQISRLKEAYNKMEQMYATEKGYVDVMCPTIMSLRKEQQEAKRITEMLQCQLMNRMKNEGSLSLQVGELATKLDEQKNSMDALVVENHELKKQILHLQTQIKIIHNSAVRGSGPSGRPAAQGVSKTFEMLLRVKSFRKALTWQKNYLMIVIHEYKNLIRMNGTGYEHPYLLQKEIPITPTSVSSINRRSLSTRFRIVGRAVIVTIRMKWMVHRWTSRMAANSMNSAMSSKENFPPIADSLNLLSPPTREKEPGRTASESHTFNRLDNVRGDDIFHRPFNPHLKLRKCTSSTIDNPNRHSGSAFAVHRNISIS